MSVTGFLINNTVQKYDYESLENYNTPDFSTSSTYQVGDYVMYQGKLYKCTTAITTGGAWDSTKWSLAILSDDVADLKSAVGNLDDLETTDKTDLVSAINEAATMGGGGGSPTPVTLASDMTDTEVNYLYLGSESGYDYGYVYVYLNGTWTKTSLYGKGQDGYSPSVSVSQTATGATIIATDKSGTTTASIENGTATDAQVAAWLDEHPEATTTVQDGSITTAKLANDVKSLIGNKTADKANWTFTLTAETVLSDTRIQSQQESSVSGYTTYLIPNSIVPVDDGFFKISGNTYYIGYYTQTGNNRTYTTNVTSAALFKNQNYTGIAICMNRGATLEDVVMLHRMSVITTKKSEVGLLGFSGYETDEYLRCSPTEDSRPNWTLKVEPNKVYAIKFDGVDWGYYQMFACKEYLTTFNRVNQAKYAVMGDYVIIASIDGYLGFSVANNTNFPNMYNSDGLKVYVLDKPWEIQLARNVVPCRAMIHAGNFKHSVLLAYALGWRGVEVDVKKTSDGVFVFSHDASVGGVQITTNTYATIKAAYPAIMTIDELIEISSYFDCTIDYHFEGMDPNDRWNLIVQGLQRGIDHLGYYTGITGNIGSESAQTFFETGIVYGYGDGMDIPSSVASAKYYIGSTGGNVTDNPQIAFVLPGTEVGSGYVTKYRDLTETYKNYFNFIAYFVRFYPLYKAECKKLSFDVSALSFASGTKRITPSVEPVYCSEDITWESSDTSVATVAASNNNNTLYPYATVTAVGSGTCTITATVGNCTATCIVTIG